MCNFSVISEYVNDPFFAGSLKFSPESTND